MTSANGPVTGLLALGRDGRFVVATPVTSSEGYADYLLTGF